jgi:hypothetical protein
VLTLFRKVDSGKLDRDHLPPELQRLYSGYRAFPADSLAEVVARIRLGELKEVDDATGR